MMALILALMGDIMSFTIKRVIAISIIAALAITSLLFFQPALSYGTAFEDYIKDIHDNYKDEVDYETLINGAFIGVLDSLGDPYSAYYSDPSRVQASEESVVGEYSGIGVQLGIAASGRCYVTAVIEGGPADRAGIVEGDLFLKVDGKDVASLTPVEVSELLKGEEGTSVSVTIRIKNGEQTFIIKREKMAITISFYEMKDNGVGYIKLMSFEKNSPAEFYKAKAELIKAGATSLIVDLRDNHGGYLNSALAIADEFIEEGDMLHLRKKGKIVQTVRPTDRKKTEIPIVLLINENSASSAEVLAAALQDNGKAILVGTGTYGKGAAQIIRKTESGVPFKISEYDLLRPNGKDIESVGVTPDYEVQNRLGERREDAAKAYDSFAPFAEDAKYKAGETGLNVFAAQQRLDLLGYQLELTAAMDVVTVATIKAFQQEQGLYAYGVLDFTTMSKIEDETLIYINNDSKEDLQLKKAIELMYRRK